MMTLIIGKENSGKSVFAEDLACQLAGNSSPVYLATMSVMDEEGERRVQKHRSQREGKGFVTIEKQIRVDEVVSHLTDAKDKTVLLECISNLVGNEMYENESRKGLSQEALVCSIFQDIRILQHSVKNLVLVTNEYAIKADYDEETTRYIQTISLLNEKLKVIAEKTITDFLSPANTK